MDPAIAQLLGYLQQVAERLGIEGSRLWPQLVFATFIQSVAALAMTIMAMIFGAIVAVFGTWRFRRQWSVRLAEVAAATKYTSSPFPPEFFWFYPMLGGAVVFIIAAGVLLAHAGDWAVGIYAPEVATVLHLAQSVQGKR